MTTEPSGVQMTTEPSGMCVSKRPKFIFLVMTNVRTVQYSYPCPLEVYGSN
jgi:hypothetical protein